MPAKIPHGKTVDTEPVILAIVAAETVIRNTVAVVTAALLPGPVLRLPAMCTISLPSDLLLAHTLRAPLLSRPVVALLTLLVLPPLGLLLLSRGVVLLTLLALLVLLPSGLLLLSSRNVLLTLLASLVLLSSGLLLLSRRIVLLTLLALLVLPPSGLLLLSCRIVLLTLLPLLVLLSSGLLLLLSCRIVLLTLPPSGLLLPFGLGLLLLFLGFGLFILLFLSSVRRSTHSHQEKKRGRTNDSNLFHGVTSIASTCAPLLRPNKALQLSDLYFLQSSRAKNPPVCSSHRADSREGVEQSKFDNEPQHRDQGPHQLEDS